MTKPHLLLVDDDRHVLESMADWLRGQGYELDASAGYADALERLRGRNFDLVLADVRLARRRRLRPAGAMPPQLARHAGHSDDRLRHAGRRDRSDSRRRVRLRHQAADRRRAADVDRAGPVAAQRAARKRQPAGPARSPLRHGQHRRPRPADAESVRNDRQRGRHAGHGAGDRRKRHRQKHDRPGDPPPQRPR